jgi:hypothetical protein
MSLTSNHCEKILIIISNGKNLFKWDYSPVGLFTRFTSPGVTSPGWVKNAQARE